MKEKLYELERKIGISDMERCTESELDAIKTILSMGKTLPDGIVCDKKGRYYKFVPKILTDDEKQRFVSYQSLIYQRKTALILLFASMLLIIITAMILVCAIKFLTT